MKHIFFTLGLILIMASCQSNGAEVSSNTNVNNNGEIHKGVALEVLQTTNYTYLKLKSNDKEIWVAVPKTDAKVGETYYFTQGMLMTDFNSKELKRTFTEIYFLEKVSTDPNLAMNKNVNPHGNMNNNTNPHGNQNTNGSKVEKVENTNLNITPAEGGVTIAEIFSDKTKYKEKTVVVKGKVTKYNEGIMNKNWVHLQDGTKSGDGKFDLTITTLDKVKLGETVTFEGKLILDKDFGHGYFYEVLLEDAKVKK